MDPFENPWQLFFFHANAFEHQTGASQAFPMNSPQDALKQYYEVNINFRNLLD